MKKFTANILNSMRNVMSGLGTHDDQATHTQYESRDWMDSELLASMYVEQWLVSKAVDIPSKDMIRPWRTFSEASASKKFKDAEKKLKMKSVVQEANAWGRLFGGSVVVPSYDNSVSREEYSQPFNLLSKREGALRGFRVFTQDELKAYGTSLNTDIFDDKFKWPESFKIGDHKEGFEIHNSWMIPFVGVKRPPFSSSPVNGGFKFGVSVIERLYDDISRSLSGLQEVSSLLGRMNIDVYKVKDLAEQLAACDGDVGAMSEMLSTRMALVALTTSNHRKIVMDAEQEDYSRHNISPSGFDAVTMTFVSMVAAGIDVPITRFLSQSPTGLNPSGSGEIKNYYDGLAGDRNDSLEPKVNLMDSIIAHDIRSEVPEWEWNALYQLTDKEQSEVNKNNAATFTAYSNAEMPFVLSMEAKRLQRDKVYEITDEQIKEIEETEGKITDDPVPNP